MERIGHLSQLLSDYLSPEDLELCMRAFGYAEEAHFRQQRQDGRPFILHPIEVAILLANLEVDAATVAAGLLHDTVEDTPTTVEDLRSVFGDRIARLVNGVTKVAKIDLAYREEEEIENVRRMLVATAEDLHVIVIKICDRLHNMRTLEHLRPRKQQRIAQTTLDIFSPLAHRLGLGQVKWELEDLSLSFLQPEAYADIKSKITLKRRDREAYLREVEHQLQNALFEEGIGCTVQSRAKHFYSIYRKMHRDGKSFDELTDLLALRVVAGNVGECYAALGVVHTLWRPYEGKFKDYIASPKPNNYRSLHSTVFGPQGRTIEVQIRTQEMHHLAERGIAAHWRYKESGGGTRLGKDAIWLEGLSEIVPDTLNPDEFLTSFKQELFADEVFVKTPKGKLLKLPLGATPIDFAYRIHTDLGNHCSGAKVNGRIAPLNSKLQTGDTVEIIPSKHGMAAPSWLEVVRTSSAKAKIRRYLLETRHDQLLQQGRSMLDKELRRTGVNPNEFYKSESCGRFLKSLKQRSVEELHVNIGFGRVSTKQILARLIQERRSESAPTPHPHQHKDEKQSAVIRLGDIDNIMYRRARCCSPLPGDDILGFVTRGRGITIHRHDCKSVQHLRSDRNRLMNLFWGTDDASYFDVDVEIVSTDRDRLLSDLSNRISGVGVSIKACHSVTDKESITRSLFTISIPSRTKLDDLMRNLVGAEGVHSVRRRRSSAVGRSRLF